MSWSASSRGMSLHTERRNFRRVLIAVFLLALAALGTALAGG